LKKTEPYIPAESRLAHTRLSAKGASISHSRLAVDVLRLALLAISLRKAAS
jgi:hypothetical protein